MIVGICVGSGIFFKVDDILTFTGGNVYLGVLVFVIGAFSIIFGSISLANMAAVSTENGGIVNYYEEFYSKASASAVGWFQTFLYYPTIAVVVAWASGIYTCLLIGQAGNFNLQMGLGLFYLVLFYILNILSSSFGGKFQVISSIAKLIPLFGVAIIALFYRQGHPEIPSTVEAVPLTNVGLGWLAALAPTAFSYDGWPISLSISGEVKDAEKTMPKALMIAPLIVLIVYLSYFLGMTKILGPEYILATGNGAVMAIGQMLLGKSGEIIILLFILISILGVVNGIILGHIRMPHALATKNIIPNSKKILSGSNKLSNNYSAWIGLGCSLFWFVIHYFTQKSGLMNTGDISEIAIVFGYLFYMILYVKVLMLYKQKVFTNFFTGLIAPILALIGGLIIVVGGFTSNPPLMIVFFIICLAFSLAGYLFYKKTAQA